MLAIRMLAGVVIVALSISCATTSSRKYRSSGSFFPVAFEEVKMAGVISTFRGLAYVTVERSGVRWASNVAVLVKAPSSVRLDAIERITDVVATVIATEDGGSIELPLESKKIDVAAGKVVLPVIGEIGISSGELAGILTGRPVVAGGARLAQAFQSTQRGSSLISGKTEEIEFNERDGLALVYTKFSSPAKKGILFEADFNDFVTFNGRKMPRHIVIRFEQPRLLMEIKYLDMQPDSPVHDKFFGRS